MAPDYSSSPMPRLTFITGGVLVAVGVIAYIVTEFSSWTALIPAIVGAVLLLSGAVALKSLMAGIHIALLVALLGAIAQLHPIFGNLMGDGDNTAAGVTALITFLVLVVYLILGVRSFLAARRWKKTNA
ncbi:hypothetical protein M3B43_12140 [Nesterenkonia massiliensis]|uniref:Permease n=1 Tax=Nesterenkonia massiliensis TaxID=1232429 RepID=A0ABT2HU47_9MICC|nr:hypothetical protein [Nesterenkonia massiliensis]MCT1608044.1 hypothetical protein [Nesterenkonia massiliensis]